MFTIDVQCPWSLVGIHLIKVVFIAFKYCKMIRWLQQDRHIVGTKFSIVYSPFLILSVESDAIKQFQKESE